MLLLDGSRLDEDNIGAEGAVASRGVVGELGELVGAGLVVVLERDELTGENNRKGAKSATNWNEREIPDNNKEQKETDIGIRMRKHKHS